MLIFLKQFFQCIEHILGIIDEAHFHLEKPIHILGNNGIEKLINNYSNNFLQEMLKTKFYIRLSNSDVEAI